MFGTNQIRGKSAFKDAQDKLLVTSIFLTIQGEGPYQGRPAVFVRLAYCNLDCSFCDTFFDQGDWFGVMELSHKVTAMIDASFVDRRLCGVVLTGGEPTLQGNISPFLERLEALGVAFTQIESNGILQMPEAFPEDTTIVISPKCSEKTKEYIAPHASTVYRAECLKFVLSSDPSSPYHEVPSWAFEWRKEFDIDIYVSPMNMYKPDMLTKAIDRMKKRSYHSIEHRSTADEVVSGWDDLVLDRAKNRENHEYAARYALKHGIMLTLQMHLFASIA